MFILYRDRMDVPVSSISDCELRLKVTKSVAYAIFVHTAIKSVVIIVLVFIFDYSAFRCWKLSYSYI